MTMPGGQFNLDFWNNLENVASAMTLVDPNLLTSLLEAQSTPGIQGARGYQGPRGASAADILGGLPIPTLEDGNAKRSTLYYSADQTTLVYKHSDGGLFRLALTAIPVPMV